MADPEQPVAAPAADPQGLEPQAQPTAPEPAGQSHAPPDPPADASEPPSQPVVVSEPAAAAGGSTHPTPKTPRTVPAPATIDESGEWEAMDPSVAAALIGDNEPSFEVYRGPALAGGADGSESGEDSASSSEPAEDDNYEVASDYDEAEEDDAAEDNFVYPTSSSAGAAPDIASAELQELTERFAKVVLGHVDPHGTVRPAGTRARFRGGPAEPTPVLMVHPWCAQVRVPVLRQRLAPPSLSICACAAMRTRPRTIRSGPSGSPSP